MSASIAHASSRRPCFSSSRARLIVERNSSDLALCFWAIWYWFSLKYLNPISSAATSLESLIDSLGLKSVRLVSLSYVSGTEHKALHAARHAEGAVNLTKARNNELNAVARIGSDEADGAGVHQSRAHAIEGRPDAVASTILAKVSSTRPGRRIERGAGENTVRRCHVRRGCCTENWCVGAGEDFAGIASRVTSLLRNLCLIVWHRQWHR